MNESPSDVWFFSRDGHQSGPITFAELKEKADEGALRPRLDLAWSAGMPEWLPVGEIEGLFERRAPTITSTPGQLLATEPGAAPEAEGWQAHAAAPEIEWPGSRRRTYLIALFIFPLLWNFVAATGKPLIESSTGKPLPSAAIYLIAFLPAVVIFWTSIQRLANLGMNRLWILGNLIPILNLWIGYRSFACPAGYAHHKKMDGLGIFLAIIYWLAVTVAIAILAAVVLSLFGVIENAELQKLIKEALEQLKAKIEVPAK